MMTNATRPDAAGNISCLIRKSSPQLFFVYAGGMGLVEGMGPMDFLRSSGLGTRNIAFVRDPNTNFFEDGIGGAMTSFDAVADWHEALIEACPHVSELYCTGNSFGGAAAMLFGHLLGVRKVWAMAPAGARYRPVLRELLSDHNGLTTYDIFFSPRLESDAAFAQDMQGLPGVSLHPRPEHGHLMIRGMMETGDYSALFPDPLNVVSCA